MNKGLQIFLLGLVFLISGAVGFLLEGILLKRVNLGKEPSVVETVPVVPEDTLSTIPVIVMDEVTTPIREADGNFSFSARAEVESGHQLKYVVYKEDACLDPVAENLSGSFTTLPPLPSKIYYLRVQNIVTGDWSESVPVEGFVQIIMYERITKALLEDLINVKKDYSYAPKDFKKRTSPSLQIVVNGANENERPVSDVADLCLKTSNNIWTSVVVEQVEYDRQNRLQKLIVRVNY